MSSDLKVWKTYVSEWARIQEACIAVADADSEDDGAYRRAQVRLIKTLTDLGWRKHTRTVCRRYITTQLPLWRNPMQDRGQDR